VTKFLGIASESVIKDFLNLIKSKNRDAIFAKIDEIHNQGIDLVQFAKQNIMYIDQNLMSDIDFLLEISEAFSEVMSTVKYYPYPTMIYKVAINKYLQKGLTKKESIEVKPSAPVAKTPAQEKPAVSPVQATVVV